MDITHIFIDDNNPAHRELSIYRTGAISRVRLTDSTYRTYGTLELSAHNHTALFHYGIVESLNELPFVSETGHGLDSWDEAFLHHTQLERLLSILDAEKKKIPPEKKEKTLLGWHDSPVAAAYWRTIYPLEFLSFLETMERFVKEAVKDGYDLEFIL